MKDVQTVTTALITDTAKEVFVFAMNGASRFKRFLNGRLTTDIEKGWKLTELITTETMSQTIAGGQPKKSNQETKAQIGLLKLTEKQCL